MDIIGKIINVNDDFDYLNITDKNMIKELSEEKSIVKTSNLKSYYRDNSYKKVPINIKIEYTKHAYNRIIHREINLKNVQDSIIRGISSIRKLSDNLYNDFKIYSNRYFIVIPGEAYFEKNLSLIRIIVKTAFISPKPSYHKHEKIIFV
ncbi:hypothetical protein [Selenomonas ruminantium]|uniref:hypothetical protein n=1 Tax=Selenomonas ruminantium TaxID=971 RepID=UPI0026EA670E|nr:hypothetical protein [Selenomonas ruminantium]